MTDDDVTHFDSPAGLDDCRDWLALDPGRTELAGEPYCGGPGPFIQCWYVDSYSIRPVSLDFHTNSPVQLRKNTRVR